MNNENQKWVVLSYIIIAFLVWYVVSSFFFSVFEMVKIPNHYLFGAFPVTGILAFALALALLIYVFKNAEISLFSNEVVGELRKVTWPNKKETSGSTLVVVIVVIIFAVILGIFDFIWVKLLQLFIA